MAQLTKAERQILKEYSNNPNYKIEVNSRNKIVAIQINQPEVKTLNHAKPNN